jgi:hypothetical protein
MGLRQSTSSAPPFLKEDGSINSSSFGGTGFARADIAYPNSIGFNSISPDRNNATFLREVRFDSNLNPAFMTDKNGDFFFGVNQFTANDFTLDLSDGNYKKAWWYGDNTQTSFGWGTPGDPFGETGFYVYPKRNISGTGNRGVLRGATGQKEMFHFSSGNYASPNQTFGTGAICSRNTQVNGQTYSNSVFLGGTSGVINKSNYAFARNFEVQNGVCRYSVAPALTNPLDMATVGYVDTAVGGVGSAEDWSGITNVTTDRTYDANSSDLDEIADVLGTLIADLRAENILG